MSDNQAVFNIPVGVDVSKPDEPTLLIDVSNRRLPVPWLGTRTFNFTITNNANLTFDKPAVTFVGDFHPSVTWAEQNCSFEWSNSTSGSYGLSYYYRIHALYNSNGTLIPVSHDPTVHNESPG